MPKSFKYVGSASNLIVYFLTVPLAFDRVALGGCFLQKKERRRSDKQTGLFHPEELERLRGNFLYEITISKKGYLTPFERLFIIHELSYEKKVHQWWLADLYSRCGCFSEAKRIYESWDDWRRLGDLAWVDDDLQCAESYYSRGANEREGALRRPGKDWIQLINLAFYKSDWETLIDTVFRSGLSRSNDGIVLCYTIMSPEPYLRMLGLAAFKSGMKDDSAFANRVCKLFGIDRIEWTRLLQSLSMVSQEELVKMQNKVAPQIRKMNHVTLAQALSKGQTIEAIRIARGIECIGDSLEFAAGRLHSFLEKGDTTTLQDIAKVIDDLTDDQLGIMFIGTFSWGTIYQLIDKRLKDNLVIDFCESHPVIRRVFIKELLKVKFRNNVDLTASDCYQGLLTSNYLTTNPFIFKTAIAGKPDESFLDLQKLIQYSDWIETKIDIWLESEGAEQLKAVRNAWNSRKARPIPPDCHFLDSHCPDKSMEWIELMRDLLGWITKRWRDEIGVERWKAEKSVLDIVSRNFKSFNVVRHAQPLWLAPQHLDIYLPELSLAIEFMGEQHYRPLEYFGGDEGFKNTVLRDKRKASTCKQVGINLIYIRFDDDKKAKIEEIKKRYV